MTVPATQTYSIMVVTSRAFLKGAGNQNTTMDIDIGYATSASATGASITQSNGSTSAGTINTGLQDIQLGPNTGNGTPGTTGMLPVTATAVLTLSGGAGGTTYHFGMIGTVSATGVWSTGTGTISALIVKP